MTLPLPPHCFRTHVYDYETTWCTAIGPRFIKTGNVLPGSKAGHVWEMIYTPVPPEGFDRPTTVVKFSGLGYYSYTYREMKPERGRWDRYQVGGSMAATTAPAPTIVTARNR